jgi:predicted ArsR family transcriptional regulator
LVSTRRELLLQLRKHPGITVSQLADRLALTNMGVRRHLDLLAAEGLAAPVPTARRGVGRPPAGWRLTEAGMELFPRRYDNLAEAVLEDLSEEAGAPAVEAVLARRAAKVTAHYEGELAGAGTLAERVQRLAGLRDDDGYLAEWVEDAEGDLLLTENNCAVHRVAKRFPILCAMELTVFRRCLGPGVEVTRVAHAIDGDPVCCYRIHPTGEADGGS